MGLSYRYHWYDYLLWPVWVVIYYLFLFIFAVLTLIVNLCALVTALFPDGAWKGNLFQSMLRAMSRGCFFIFHYTGIVRVELRGFDRIETERSAVKPILIANHPSLIDVFIFYIKLPRLTCIYKDSLKKTLIKGRMGEEIGFISNANPRKMIREAVAKIGEGEQLLIFPEGTRTWRPPINPFKPGAAGVANKAGVALQTVMVYCSSNVLSKEQSPFRIPRLPIRFILEVGDCFDPADYGRHTELNQALEAYFARCLNEGPHGLDSK